MGEILTQSVVRAGKKPKRLMLTWDNGSPWTFISESASRKLGTDPIELGEPKVFHGLGDGQFQSRYAMYMHFKLKGVWCNYFVFVVPDEAIPEMDVLVGHEFMQVYNIHLIPKQRRVIAKKKDLLRASFVY